MRVLHDAAGYVAGALVAARVVWGFVGSRYARFSQFVRAPETVVGYVRTIADGVPNGASSATIQQAGR